MNSFTAGQIERIREQWMTREAYDSAEPKKNKSKNSNTGLGHSALIPKFELPRSDFSWSELNRDNVERMVIDGDSDTEMDDSDSDYMDTEYEFKMQIE
jgi:hypothetical protein